MTGRNFYFFSFSFLILDAAPCIVSYVRLGFIIPETLEKKFGILI